MNIMIYREKSRVKFYHINKLTFLITLIALLFCIGCNTINNNKELNKKNDKITKSFNPNYNTVANSKKNSKNGILYNESNTNKTKENLLLNTDSYELNDINFQENLNTIQMNNKINAHTSLNDNQDTIIKNFVDNTNNTLPAKFRTTELVFRNERISDCLLPYKGQIIDAFDIEKGYFNVTLNQIYSTDQILTIEQAINRCNKRIEKKITNYQDLILSINRNKINIEKFQNIINIKDRVDTLKKEKRNIQKTLKKSFSELSFHGIYGVVLDAGYENDYNVLLTCAKKVIAQKAISDILETCIRSETSVIDGKIFFDKIISSVSGQIQIKKTIVEERKFFKGKNQFIFAAIISIAPLQSKIKFNTKILNFKYLTANLLSSSTKNIFLESLKKRTSNSYAQKIIHKINKVSLLVRKDIFQKNSITQELKNKLLSEYSQLIKNKEKEIQIEKNKLEKKRSELKQYYLKAGFHCSKFPESCIDETVNEMNHKISKLIKLINSNQKSEIVYSDVIVPQRGKLKEEIFRLTKNLYKDMKTLYGKKELFLNIAIVESQFLSSDQNLYGSYINRHPDKVFLYPFSNDNGDMKIKVVMTFKINQENRINVVKEEATKKEVKKIIKKETTKSQCTLHDINFVLIKTGIFFMGSPFFEPGRDNDEHRHQENINYKFYIQQTEVTQKLWKNVMGYNPSNFKNEEYPVENISWFDAKKFIKKLNSIDAKNKYRLPTEAEWEYACRAGSQTAFSNGTITNVKTCRNLDKIGWYIFNSNKRTHVVANKISNAWGLFDMHGNVWEWCGDIVNSNKRIARGGSWSETARYSRSANRVLHAPDYYEDTIGLRLVKEYK